MSLQFFYILYFLNSYYRLLWFIFSVLRNSGGKGGVNSNTAAPTSSAARHFGRWGSLKDRRQPSHLDLYAPRQRLSTADVDSGEHKALWRRIAKNPNNNVYASVHRKVMVLPWQQQWRSLKCRCVIHSITFSQNSMHSFK